MRIVTLTLHPAIDRIVRVESLVPGATFDGRCEFRVPSGKGVNTARSLRCVLPSAKKSGEDEALLAAVWIGENEATWFARELLRKWNIRAVLYPRVCSTRSATTILERDGRETHIKEAMDSPSATERSTFLNFWKKTLRRGDIVALCGSAPAGTPPDFLRAVFAIARESGCAAIIADTNGPALVAAGKSSVTGIKGNGAEIGAWLRLPGSLDYRKVEHRVALKRSFARPGAPQSIFVTLGPAGALLATRERILFAAAPKVQDSFIVSATGCGDAATAGWLWALRDGESSEETLRRAIACGTAKLATADPGSVDPRHVKAFLKQVKVTSS